MIFHFSMAADDPRRTAMMLAELWRGEASYFPMVGEGSWVAHAGDDRNSTIEVYPRTVILRPHDAPAEPGAGSPSRYSGFHAAIETPLSADEVEALAKRYGCRTVRCERSTFGVIELWIDDSTMLEVLPPDMAAQYRQNGTFAALQGALRHFGVDREGCPVERAQSAPAAG